MFIYLVIHFSTVCWTNTKGETKTTMIDERKVEGLCAAMKDRGITTTVYAEGDEVPKTDQ